MEQQDQHPQDQQQPNKKVQTISIITNSDIRYEGSLFQINEQKQEVVLNNVKSFGTEGRRPGNEIPAPNLVYEYIVFKGCEIKDIVMVDEKVEEEVVIDNCYYTDEIDFESLNSKF